MAQYTLEDLLHLMARLRDPETGCPWDIRQDFASIAPYTVEEAHEVADAIASADYPHLEEELGDLLFQVIYHARMADERSLFDFSSVLDGLVEKLIRRHPHVFPDGTLASRRPANEAVEEVDVKRRWQEIKQAEKQASSSKKPSGLLEDMPASLPALKSAQAIQAKAAGQGFDWPDVAPVFDKLREEIDELEQAWRSDAIDAVRDETGDLLFSCVNLARHVGVDAEQSLLGCNHKFRRRFSYIESHLKVQGKKLQDCSLSELDALWDEAKSSGL
ncbi:nucleoside triphosphate pyrophosphohydrolase [Kistimonas asteriae]|uniref:nucleoside triphosphate pyrophosphohydrolase n=1 Tax=Kistimonas asteriae TaxID=517724 RepID=UPI001BAA21F5|nr:nucleoside triphosphate pyrophosphohydrolase [Kistimonas asteriae]